jgi:hypothetical protein
MRNKWTNEELNFITENYQIMTDYELSLFLTNHTEISIANKRKRMGLLRQKLKHSFEDVKNAFAKTDYILISDEEDFKDMATNSLKYICPKHEHKGIQTISLCHLESGRGCYWCGREITENARRTGYNKDKIEQDKQLCKDKNFEYIETKTINGRICIGFICNEHKEAGVQYMRRGNMNRDNIIGCKYCVDKKKYKFSKGEKRIENYLQHNNYSYIKQYIFDDCKDKNALPFDFYLTNQNIIIEFDGQHHYKPVTFNGISYEEATRNYETTVYHDKIKNNYCFENNIKIIRIPYGDYNNIEIILDKELCNQH